MRHAPCPLCNILFTIATYLLNDQRMMHSLINHLCIRRIIICTIVEYISTPIRCTRTRTPRCRGGLARCTIRVEISRRSTHRRRRLCHRQPLRRMQDAGTNQYGQGTKPYRTRFRYVQGSGHCRLLSWSGGQYHTCMHTQRD